MSGAIKVSDNLLEGERSYFLDNWSYQKWAKGELLLGRAEGSQEALFSISKEDADRFLEESGGSKTKLADALGLKSDAFNDGPVHRVDINFSHNHNLRFATGYEPGTNCFFNTPYSFDNKPDIVFAKQVDGPNEIVLASGEVLGVDYRYKNGVGVVFVDGIAYELIDEKRTPPDDLARLNGRYVTTSGFVHEADATGYKGLTSGGIQEAITNRVPNVSLEVCHFTLFGGYSDGEKVSPFDVKMNYTALCDAVGSYQDLIREIDFRVVDQPFKTFLINEAQAAMWANITNDRVWEEEHGDIFSSFGFYKELDELRADGLPDANFGFLENVPVGDSYNLYDFLHGHCDQFAAALSDYYGYEVEYVLDNNDNLVHAYCVAEVGPYVAYIDARGVTTDAELFFDEFADWCTYDKGELYDLNGECRVFRHKDTIEMYSDDNRKMNQDDDLVQFFKDNGSYYSVKAIERELVENMTLDNKGETFYRLTARSMFGEDYSQRSSFPDETYGSLEEAKGKCREFVYSLASHMRAGIEEVYSVPGSEAVKTGAYWELFRGEFLERTDIKTLDNWPKDLYITQWLQVGDKVDNSIYEYFLNLLPPKVNFSGFLQAGGSCDCVEDKNGLFQNTYLTFSKNKDGGFWVFNGECFLNETTNRNPDIEPTVDSLIKNAVGKCEEVNKEVSGKNDIDIER